MKRKGFTLIELIVVMAIIAILVLFGAPKYLEYVGEAKVTSIKTNIKELETASATYFMKRNELPTLTVEVLTSEQVQGLSEDIYDKRGKTEEIEEGIYHYVDYSKIQNYLKAPKESEKYILHTSGRVYYLGNEVADSGIIYKPEDFFIVDENGMLTGFSEVYIALGSKAPSDIVIPSEVNGIKVTSIGPQALAWAWNITSVVIPEGVISVEESAFAGCDSLESVVIPDSVERIESSAFSYCSSLKSIELPKNLIYIGDFAFSDCSSLTNIIIPEGITTLSSSLFNSCTSLESIVIPDSVERIEGAAFAFCSSLKNVKLPENLTYLGLFAFKGCSSLTNITIPAGVTTLRGYVFESCNSITTIEVPSTVTKIEKGAFELWIPNQTIIVNGTGKTFEPYWSGGATVVYK